MPLYVPANIQGASSGQSITLSADPETLLIWRHYINNAENLLIVGGGVEILNNDEVSAEVTITIRMDNTIIDDRTITIPSGGANTASFGVRRQNVSTGHHVFNVTAVSDSEDVIASNRSGFSISGIA